MEIVNNSRMGILISNQYFDFENIEQPVQTYMDNPVDFYPDPDETMYSVINIRRHNYKLNDNLFGINPSQEGVFYSAVPQRSINYNIGVTNDLFFRADFFLDARIDIYERTLRNFIDVLGDIGGIFEIIHLILSLPLTYFSKKLFEYEISSYLSRFKSLLYDDGIELNDLKNQSQHEEFHNDRRKLVNRNNYDELLSPYKQYCKIDKQPQKQLGIDDLIYSLF